MTQGRVYKFNLLERYDADNAVDRPVWTITPPDWLISVVKLKLVTTIDPAA